MKEHTHEEMVIIAAEYPGKAADIDPDWMADNHAVFMEDCRYDWMARNRTEHMIKKHEQFMKEFYFDLVQQKRAQTPKQTPK